LRKINFKDSLRSEFQEILERATKQVVTTSSEIILSKFQEMHEILAAEKVDLAHVKMSQPANDYEERIRTLEELVMLQQEEQSKLTKQLKMAVDLISSTSNVKDSRPSTPTRAASTSELQVNMSLSTLINVQSYQKQFNEKLELLESKFVREDKKRSSHFEERIDTIERLVKVEPMSFHFLTNRNRQQPRELPDLRLKDRVWDPKQL
jgi:hypothetical protein